MTNGDSQRPRTPVDLTDPAVVEAFVRYDELEGSELKALRQDPRGLAVLERLERADHFLATAKARADAAKGAGRSGDADSNEVNASQLYDYGGGPGSRPLASGQRDEITRFLEENPREKQFVDTLRTSPPSPLLDASVESEVEAIERVESAGAEISDDREARPRLAFPATDSDQTITEGAPSASRSRFGPAWLAWTPLAAAALVVAMALGGGERRSVLAGDLPESPILRSGLSGKLLFPRGRVLPPSEAGGYASSPLLEVTDVEGADAYVFKLRKLSSDAFEGGSEIWASRAIVPSATASALAPGAYEWSAAAVINGLERTLGTQSFLVMESAPMGFRAMDSASPNQSQANESRNKADAARASIARLHAAGFLTDARHLARSLPPSDERDAYLSANK